MKNIVTRESVIEYIDRNAENRSALVNYIGRALVVVFNNQTDTEQKINETTKHNDIGFTGADAHGGSITAKYFLKHHNLLDWQIERWTKKNSRGIPRIAKYWKQLDVAAKAKIQVISDDSFEYVELYRKLVYVGSDKTLVKHKFVGIKSSSTGNIEYFEFGKNEKLGLEIEWKS